MTCALRSLALRSSENEIGRDDWIRTSDPLTPSQVRYQAALHPEISIAVWNLVDVVPNPILLLLRRAPAPASSPRRRSRASAAALRRLGAASSNAAVAGRARAPAPASPQSRAAPASPAGCARARRSPSSVVELRAARSARRPRCSSLQLPPRAGERQPFDEQQVLDPQHALDVGAPIDARTALRSSRRRDRETPPPTSAARTAAPARSRTPQAAGTATDSGSRPCHARASVTRVQV